MSKRVDLLLHCGAQKASREQIRDVVTPSPSGRNGRLTHHPISHHTLIEKVVGALDRAGLTVEHTSFALGDGLLNVDGEKQKVAGGRLFGLLQLGQQGPHEDVATILGLRNFHDKQGPAGFVMGEAPFVCDNLAFGGEVSLFRKHTMNIARDLPQMIDAAIGKLSAHRHQQDARITRYKETEMTDLKAHDLLVRGVEARVVPVTKLPKVLEQWRTPNHPEFKDRTAWSLFNAFTEVLKDSNLFRAPRAGMALNGLMDQACGLQLAHS
jgi:hypothetical protein